ncbi:MAG: acyl-CoA thioesterase [Bacteroidetes bacterium]|nr:acyl-CoA thioesterase [Bacteroidota bacterium]
MLQSETKIRVRYGETDKMGYVYYGNYAQYYEVARTEFVRKYGVTYKELEERGIMLPVNSLKVKYIKPAFYDDVLTVQATINELPGIRIHFDYKVFNQNNELLNVGETTLVFVDMKTGKPVKAPEFFLDNIKQFF